MSTTATIRTDVEHPELVASALRPDNTSEMETQTEKNAVVTHIERDDSSGLHSTVDDYVVNLTVAVEVVQHANQHTSIEL